MSASDTVPSGTPLHSRGGLTPPPGGSASQVNCEGIDDPFANAELERVSSETIEVFPELITFAESAGALLLNAYHAPATIIRNVMPSSVYVLRMLEILSERSELRNSYTRLNLTLDVQPAACTQSLPRSTTV